MSRAFRCLTVGGFIVLIASGGCDEPTRKSTSVDFHRDVMPIFRSSCLNCHGDSQQLGGLRLDQKSGLSGGLSGKPLVGATTAESELIRRVTANEPEVLMPKEGGRLSDHAIETLKRWVDEGAMWPDIEPPSGPREFQRRYGEDLWDRLSILGREPKIYLLLVIAIAMLVSERVRKIATDQPAWSSGWRLRLKRGCDKISPVWLLVWFVGIVLTDVVQFSMRQSAKLASTEVKLADAQRTPSTGSHALTGPNPMPIRPRNGPKFGGEYYRGNDERNLKLFNGGYYRTATMRLALVDENDRPIEGNQRIEGSQLFVRLEIQRAPSATPTLFKDETMKNVMLTRRTADLKKPLPDDEPALAQVVEPGERWAVRYRVGEFQGQEEAALHGTVYVYSSGTRSEESVSGSIHYGIVYSLLIRERTLQPNSELWIGPVLVPGSFVIPNPNQFPLEEWFDVRPIPEITGENSTDPSLLGVPEHIKEKQPDQ